MIIDYNKSPNKLFTINLKGVMIGNGCTDVTECTVASNYYSFHLFNYIGG
jgi:serine carboxypeptidase-like clade 2